LNGEKKQLSAENKHPYRSVCNIPTSQYIFEYNTPENECQEENEKTPKKFFSKFSPGGLEKFASFHNNIDNETETGQNGVRSFRFERI